MKKIMIDEMKKLERWGDQFNELEALKAEAEEARTLAEQNNMEVVFAFYWTDDYGRKQGDTLRTVCANIEEAMNAYEAKKDGNGGYVQGWVEVRKMGEAQRMAEIREEMKKLAEALEALEKGN